VPQPPATFDLTVRPYGEDGAAPIIRSGEIVIDLGNDRREASIGPNGELTLRDSWTIQGDCHQGLTAG